MFLSAVAIMAVVFSVKGDSFNNPGDPTVMSFGLFSPRVIAKLSLPRYDILCDPRDYAVWMWQNRRAS